MKFVTEATANPDDQGTTVVKSKGEALQHDDLETLWKKNHVQVKDFDADPNNMEKECPTGESFALFNGDMAPVAMEWRLKDADKTGKHNRIIPFATTFHSFAEMFETANDMNHEWADFLARQFMGKNKKEATNKSVDFFLHFNDPTEPERKMGIVLHAFWTIASVQKICASKSTAMWTSVAGVHECILQHCATSPQDFSLCVAVKCWLVVVLCRKSERTNDLDLFFVCMRLSLPILATMHKIAHLLCLLQSFATLGDRGIRL